MLVNPRAVGTIVSLLLGLLSLGCTALPGANSSLSFNVVGFGAKGDGETLDTVAFQHAIEAARQAGGATVIVPSGNYVIAPIDLCSGLRLQLATGAVVRLTDDQALYPLIDSRFDGIMQPSRRAGLLADGCSNITISGNGTIDGQGAKWWSQVRQASTAADHYAHRPAMIQLRNCRNVRIEGVKLTNTARSAVHVLFSESISVRGASFEAPEGSDTTGIEVDSSRAIRIDGSRLAVGSRGISIESGRRDPSPRPARPTEDVSIRDCTFAQSAAAVAIGPNVAGGVLRVKIASSRFESGDAGVQIQSSPDRTGTIQAVRLADLQMNSVSRPFVISLQGKSLIDGTGVTGTPSIRDIEIARLTAEGALRAGIIEGLESAPIRNLRFDTLNLSANYGISCSRAADVVFNTVQIATDFGPAILRTDTTNLQINNWVEATRRPEVLTTQPATTQTAN